MLDNPRDPSHIISFSGENGRRDQDNVYELQVDKMLLNSKDRPRVDGLPVPSAEPSAGSCKQVGIITKTPISSISCAATTANGKKYELQFESDGSPITLRKIRQSSLTEEKHRVKKAEQLECRRKADIAKVLPRDWTPFVIRCLAEDGEKEPAKAEQRRERHQGAVPNGAAIAWSKASKRKGENGSSDILILAPELHAAPAISSPTSRGEEI